MSPVLARVHDVVVMDLDLVVQRGPRRFAGRDELLQLAEAIVPQHPVVFGVEQAERLLAHLRQAIGAGTKMHAAFAVIAQIEL